MIARARRAVGAATRVRKAAPGAARAPGGYRQLLRWAALPVTDRRWAAPLSAIALGFGLFAGVAIGPGATGTFATGAAQVIEIPGFSGGTDNSGDGGDGNSSSTASTGGVGSGGGEGSTSSGSGFSSFAPSEFESESSESPERSSPPAEPPPETELEEEKETLAGVVLHVNPAAGSYTIAEPGGTLGAVHAGKVPQPGTKVSVLTRLLANGTFAEAGTRAKTGKRARATFNGIVTYVESTPAAPVYTVSKRGVSVLVHVHPDPSGAAPTLPALGAFAKVAVDIESPQPPAPPPASPSPPVEPAAAPVGEPAPPVEPAPTATPPSCATDPSQPPLPAIQPSAILWQRQLSAEGAPFTYSDFAGVVEAVCPDSGQILISADDIRESLHDLVFTVPATIDTTKLKVGQSVLSTATIGADGTLALTGLANDEHSRGADDAEALQGDLAESQAR